MKKLLTLTEAAEQLRRPEATLRYWRATSVGPRSCRIQGRVMYQEEDIAAWIEEQFSKESA
jgi:hypothetical protein